MARLVKLGNKIRLNLQLSDDDVDAYPQATLKDALGVDLGASPVDLSHVGGGLYKDSSVNMPSTEEVTAQIRVYSDASHLAVHPCHTDTLLDVYERDFNGEALDALVAGALPGQVLSGTLIDEGFMVGKIDDLNQSLIGTINDSEALIGKIIDPETLRGTIHGGEQLNGVIDC